MLCWCSSLLCFILRMAFFAQEDKSKLASNGSKSLPELLRKACAQCHGSGLRTLSNLSSVDESTLDSDLDHKQVRSLHPASYLSHLIAISLSSSADNTGDSKSSDEDEVEASGVAILREARSGCVTNDRKSGYNRRGRTRRRR